MCAHLLPLYFSVRPRRRGKKSFVLAERMGRRVERNALSAPARMPLGVASRSITLEEEEEKVYDVQKKTAKEKGQKG